MEVTTRLCDTIVMPVGLAEDVDGETGRGGGFDFVTRPGSKRVRVTEVTTSLRGVLTMLIVVEGMLGGEIGCGGGFDLVIRTRFEIVCMMDLNTDLRGSRAGVGLRGAMVVLSVGWGVEYGDEGKDE